MLTADRRIDRRILLEADSLGEAGFEVTIVAMPRDVPGEDEDSRIVRVGSVETLGGREGFVIRSYSLLRGVLTMNGIAMRFLRQVAWRFIVDQESFFNTIFRDALAERKSDIVVAHDLPMLPVAREYAERVGARLIYDSHELFCEQLLSRFEKRKWAEIEARNISECDSIISVNSSIALELERRYGISRVDVVQNAERPRLEVVNRRLFHSKFGFSEDTRVLLLQGGLSAGRNIERFVEAMQFVISHNVVLVVLGDGNLEGYLKGIVRKRNLQERVYFHGAVPQEELLHYTASADVGAIPYIANCLNNYYCTPNRMYEYIAAGLPIIASDLPEVAKIVLEREIGCVFDVGDAKKIGAQIESVFQDGALLEKWRKNAIIARSEVSWENEGRKVVSIFTRVLDS